MSPFARAAAQSIALVSLVALPGAATLGAERAQALDGVAVYSAKTVLDMAFGNAARPPDFTDFGTSGTSFTACTLTANGGLFCLDANKSVRQWPSPAVPTASFERVSCLDPALGLARYKPDVCTAMTADVNRAIWLGAREGINYGVFKIVLKTGAACPTHWSTLSGGAYCAQQFYPARQRVTSMSAIDGEAAESFRPCAWCEPQGGVLGIEDGERAMFYPDPRAWFPIIAVTSWEWDLQQHEELLDATLLQLPVDGGMRSYVLATTSKGRVLAKDPTAWGKALKVYDIPLRRASSSAACSQGDQHYGIRASATDGTVYVTDRNYCQVTSLAPVGTPLTGLQKELTLSTADAQYPAVYAPLGVTTAPGTNIDLRDCAGSCTLVNSSAAQPAAELMRVKLAPSSSNPGARVFQIRDIPDCRYAAKSGFDPAQRQVCITTPNVVINPNGSAAVLASDGSSGMPPASQRLNVTPLLPRSATSAFDSSGVPPAGLPMLLISRQHRAQADNGFTFEALFIVTQPGTSFVDTFAGEFDVGGLEGDFESLGCTPGGNLIEWDVVSTVSEQYIGVGNQYVDMLSNTGCGTTRTAGSRLSLVPYDLEVSPDTWGPTKLYSQPVVTYGNDAVFARLVQSQFADLRTSQVDLACKKVDPAPANAGPPIGSDTCKTLTSRWENAKQKLDKCVDGAFDSKHGNSGENCNAFRVQLSHYRSAVPAVTPAHDVANRVGELKTRVDVILHVFDTRFLPSIPRHGFCRELQPGGGGASERSSGGGSYCPDPWRGTTN